jgi:hypothetical protein
MWMIQCTDIPQLMLSVRTPSAAECSGKLRSELTREFLLDIVRMKISAPEQNDKAV